MHAEIETTYVSAPVLTRSSDEPANRPYASQTFDAASLEQYRVLSVVEILERAGTSVSINDAQNNRLQPDVQYRGFSASPLLGLSQGIAAYQNGVRLNEIFGDTVNWDLLPSSSTYSAELTGGSNAIYGLNAIGGALVLTSRTGFNSPGGAAALNMGEFETREASITHGWNDERLGVFLAVDAMDEQGWRDYSDSEALTGYAALSWRNELSSADLFLQLADNNLRGNGPSPEALLRSYRDAVFTHPDITDNRLDQLSLSIRHSLSDEVELDINLFGRSLDVHSFNGDGSEYEACEEPPALEAYLCDEDGEPAEDQDGGLVDAGYDAVNNRSRREQRSAGMTAQLLFTKPIGGVDHSIAVGADFLAGETEFSSSAEYASLTDTRGTVGSGLLDAEGFTNLRSQVRSWALFASDAFALGDRAQLSASVRYNVRELDGRDPTGDNPELAGKHRFENWNGGLGLVFEQSGHLQFYGSLQTSSRAPTAVELACAHPEAPCRLPNSFLADPPLDDVRSFSAEFGLRGSGDFADSWRVGTFVTHVHDDILFQTSGGISSNNGYFSNEADTRRAGIELAANGQLGEIDWRFSYTWLQATFEDSFVASSPNNPAAVDGKLRVSSGDDIPGLPDHNLKLGVRYRIAKSLTLSADYRYLGESHLRGDEANIDSTIDAYSVLDIGAEFAFGEQLLLTASIDNVLDNDYESFGLYGDADEVLPDLDNDSGRFLGPGAPRMMRVGVEYRW